MNSTNTLLEFARKLEQKNVVSSETGIKIRGYIRKTESASNWEMFLVISGILGALFASAGIFSLISHNWYDINRHIRAVMSIVPVTVALYFYYLALFKHKDSKTWAEASSLFLMLMIGASLALVSQCYHLDGNFKNFIKIWLILTIPLFYLAKSSFISAFYLGLACVLIWDYFPFSNFIMGHEIQTEGMTWFWIIILSFLPHYYMSLNKDSQEQGARVIFMSYFLYFAIMIGLFFMIKSNYLLWFFVAQTGFYLFGKRFMADNKSVLARPFQWLSQYMIVSILASLSYEEYAYFAFEFDSIFNYDMWGWNEFYDFSLLLIFGGAVYYAYFKSKEKFKDINPLIAFAPGLILLAMIVENLTTSWWWLSILLNLMVLIIGALVIIQGSEKGSVFKMGAGLFVIASLLWTRYFDTDIGFITKGIAFIGVGGLFFLINLLVKDKIEDIERHKKLTDEK